MELKCWEAEQALELAVIGNLKSKFRDKSNHNYKTIEIVSANETVRSTILVSEWNNIYDSLMINDSIFKKKGSLNLKVLRNGQVFFYDLDFGCEEL